MLGLVISALGWAGVALAMVSRGVASMVARVTQPDGVVNEQLVVIVAFGLIALLVLLVRHGLNAIRRLNDFAGPGFLILAVISLSLLLHRYGVRHLWTANVPAEQALTHDRLKSFAYALDFGVTTALSWWPFMGALYRYVKFRRHTVGPILVGGSLVGNVFSASVAALAAVHLGSPDPAVWLTELAGPVAGTAMVCVVLLFSVPAVCMQVFFVAGAIQQLRPLARTPWSWLVALSVAPLSLVAINTAWTLSHIVTVATMGSLVFFAACGIVMADYWVLRRGNIDPPQLFVAGPEGDYWYWGGVNWVAIAVIAASVVGYLGLYNPITLETRSAFRFLGAALPATALSSMAYYALMRSIVIPMKLGGFGGRAMASAGSKPVEVGL
jgi:cytosine/uracil/thiamine/allantoin permease